jgi:hypothetical protein
MTTAEIKELLDANTKLLSSQIEMSRELFSVKFAELKEDTQDIKLQAKEINGQVKKNSGAIIVLEEAQKNEIRRRKHALAIAGGALTAALGSISAFILTKLGS